MTDSASSRSPKHVLAEWRHRFRRPGAALSSRDRGSIIPTPRSSCSTRRPQRTADAWPPPGTGSQIDRGLSFAACDPRSDDRDQPAAYVDLDRRRRNAIGTFLVSADQDMLPQHFATENPHRTWKISNARLNAAISRFRLTLLKFSNDLYPGTGHPEELIRAG